MSRRSGQVGRGERKGNTFYARARAQISGAYRGERFRLCVSERSGRSAASIQCAASRPSSSACRDGPGESRVPCLSALSSNSLAKTSGCLRISSNSGSGTRQRQSPMFIPASEKISNFASFAQNNAGWGSNFRPAMSSCTQLHPDRRGFRVRYLLEKMARPERFELPTFWFVARRSIQLS